MIYPNPRVGASRLALVAALIFASLSSLAQSPEGWSASLTHENDAFALNGKGENYTSGWKFELLTSSVHTKLWPFPRLNDSSSVNVQRLLVGAYGFTPQVVTLSDVDIYDRPYASFSYIGVGQASYNLHRGLVINSDLRIGAVGLEGFGKFQKWYTGTGAFGATTQMGWGNQLDNGGKPAVNYGISITKNSFHSSQIFLRFFLRNIHHEVDTLNLHEMEEIHVDTLMSDRSIMRDLANLYAAEVGFEFLQTRLTAGANVGTLANNLFATLRINLMNVNRYSLLNYVPHYINAYGPLHATDHRHHGIDKVRFHIFVRPTVRLVGSNAFLTGVPYGAREGYHLQSSDIKRVLFEMEAGFDLTLWQNIDIVYMWSARSREFEGGRRLNTWGSLSLGYSPRSWNPIK